jgi:hypothetical protein
MKHPIFGRSCPVCAGPLVQGEGSEGCVLCGYAIQAARRPRLRLAAIRNPQRYQRPRQLMLPISGI